MNLAIQLLLTSNLEELASGVNALSLLRKLTGKKEKKENQGIYV